MPRKETDSVAKELELLQAQIDLLDEMLVLEMRAMKGKVVAVAMGLIVVFVGVLLGFFG